MEQNLSNNPAKDIKISDLICNYLISKGITDVFGYPGGMVTYLMDSLSKHAEKISAHLSYHEQGAAFCACGYAQSSGKTGVAYATSGPGAINLMGGIANAYFDSIPCLFITGQVNTYESKGNLPVRQKGFQETDIISITKSITKYSKYVDSAENVLYELEKAFYFANSGRPGPVLLDIPMNVQRTKVNPENLKHFNLPTNSVEDCDKFSNEILAAIHNSNSPLIIAGAGIRTSGTVEIFIDFVEKLKIPVVTSMISVDVLPNDSPLKFGMIGSYGARAANFIIEKSDLILAIGSRLDCRQTGSDKSKFATKAKLIRVDTDINELANKIKEDEIQVHCSLQHLLPKLNKNVLSWKKDSSEWLKECNRIKNKLQNIDSEPVNRFIEEFSVHVPDGLVITADVGQNQVWTAQSFKNKPKQKILFSGGYGSMGYSLPAAIGAYFATKEPVICIVGDGGFQMNIQELQMVARDNLPIKIVLIDNNALGMIRHFQEMYFECNYFQTKDEEYSVPDLKKIVDAYGIKTFCYESCKNDLDSILTSDKPAFIYYKYDQNTYVSPKLAINKPIYDQEPLLDRKLLKELLNDKS